MIIKILLLVIVIVILYLSINTLDTFTTSVSSETEKVEIKDQDIIQLESIVSEQASELREMIEDRKSLQQDISDIAELVYTDETTSVSSDPTSTSTGGDPTSTSTPS